MHCAFVLGALGAMIKVENFGVDDEKCWKICMKVCCQLQLHCALAGIYSWYRRKDRPAAAVADP